MNYSIIVLVALPLTAWLIIEPLVSPKMVCDKCGKVFYFGRTFMSDEEYLKHNKGRCSK